MTGNNECGKKATEGPRMFTVMGVSRFALFFRSSKDEDGDVARVG